METSRPDTANFGFEHLMESSQALKSGMGAVAWAVLEMFRRGGMDDASVKALHDQMNKYFTVPSNDECNSILRVVQKRLEEDQTSAQGIWY